VTSRAERHLIILALGAVGLPVVACGYRPARSTLPGGHESVQVVLPNPGRVGEPALPRMIVVELCRRLTRAGLRASSGGAAATVLSSRILALEGLAPVLAGNAMAGRRLRLRMEFRLHDSGGQTVWRSGLVEVEQLWTLDPGDTTASEASRLRSLQDLAARAARDAVERLLLGG